MWKLNKSFERTRKRISWSSTTYWKSVGIVEVTDCSYQWKWKRTEISQITLTQSQLRSSKDKIIGEKAARKCWHE